MSNIRVAESAGFCFGVKRAIEMAYEAIGVELKLYSYGQLIHNKTVTDDLASKGLQIVENLDGLTEGTLLIRSHGVGKALYDEAEAKGLKILDGTCPFVKKIHDIVHDKLAEGLGIIIVGDGTHPEVIGINGWCENAAVILEDEEAAKTKEIPEKRKIRRCGADHIPSGKIRQDSGNFAGQRRKYGSP